MPRKGITTTRNEYGFSAPPSYLSDTASCCSSVGPRRCTTPSASADTYNIDSLVVGDLFTSKQVGGTLVLNGDTCRGTGSNLALYVKKDTRIDGHTFTKDIQASGEVNTVLGFNGAYANVGQPYGLTVDGAVAGPFATQAAIETITLAHVTITDGTSVNSGFAISPNLLVTSLWWNTADQIPIVSESYTLNVIVTLPDGTPNTFNATVVCTSSSAGIAILSVHHSYTFKHYLEIVDDVHVQPYGTPVLIGGGNQQLGTRTFHNGIVTDGSVTMFYEYTSVHVCVTGSNRTPSVGCAGGPILNVYGKVVGMVQYGVENSGAGYTGTLGGVSSRYLAYVRDEFLKTGSPQREIPVIFIESDQIYPRGISAQERTPYFLPGGVAGLRTLGTADRDSQALSVTFNTSAVPVELGMRGQNNVSLQQAILDAAIAGATSATIRYAPLSVGAATETLSNDQVAQDKLWLIVSKTGQTGTGSPIIGSIPPTGGFCSQALSNKTTFEVTEYSQDVKSIQSANFTCTISGTSIGWMTFGDRTTGTDYRAVNVLWGKKSACNLWIKNFGVANDPALIAAWDALYATLTDTNVVFAVFLAPENPTSSWDVENYTDNTSLYGDNYDITVEVNAAGNTIEVNTTGPVLGGNLSGPFLKTFNVFSFLTDVFSASTCHLLSNSSVVVYKTENKVGTLGAAPSGATKVF